jgi:hypothetical protein
MDDPLLAADNDNAGLGATTTVALRGTSLDLRTVVARLLAAGPAGLLAGIALASPAASLGWPFGPSSCGAASEARPHPAPSASGASEARQPPSAGPLAEPARVPVLPPLSTQELELIREMAMRDEVARDMLAEAGWTLALETSYRPAERDERPPMQTRGGPDPRPVFGEASGEGGRLCLGLGAAAMTAGFALWGYLG